MPLPKKISVTFWLLVGTFLLGVAGTIIFGVLDLRIFNPFPILILALTILGIPLIVLVEKSQLVNPLRRSLLVTGFSASGIIVAAILHNLVYGLFTTLWPATFGGDWDEPVFFIIAIIVLPLTFIISAIWSAVLIIKGDKK
jgi:hypothetical protein